MHVETDPLGVPPARCSVFLCDDTQLLREAVAHVLDDDPRFELVGQAADVASCVEQVADHAPDLVILDVNMPGGGPEGARAVKEVAPDTYILVYTALDNPVARLEMLAAGADAYLLKSGRLAPLLDALVLGCQASARGSQ